MVESGSIFFGPGEASFVFDVIAIDSIFISEPLGDGEYLFCFSFFLEYLYVVECVFEQSDFLSFFFEPLHSFLAFDSWVLLYLL